MKVSDADFLENEDMALRQETEDLIFYGLPINKNIVRLHHEFSSTSCPHRSMALHGGPTDSVKSYFVERMNYFATLGSTVDEMLGNASSSEPVTASSYPGSNSLDEDVAREVIAGVWGNGQDRVNRLTNAGYDYNTIQQKVNELLG
ncbi:hypothetical protein [Gemella cuniculi]|uniref:hypothetical protein n=1 Tax=Gemella cuniculi TaxID=150240 RepID=UPI00040BBA86|nr:hypothetical protein [Gemella cuniculi]